MMTALLLTITSHTDPNQNLLNNTMEPDLYQICVCYCGQAHIRIEVRTSEIDHR